MPVTVNPIECQDSNERRMETPSEYYDKRLCNICQVSQMKYLDENLKPKEDAVKAVKEGKLYIEKIGQSYRMIDERLNDKKKDIADEISSTHKDMGVKTDSHSKPKNKKNQA